MILIGVGANLDGIYGTPEQCLRYSVKLLSESGIDIIKSSSIWKSAPVPISSQPWYRNAVHLVSTNLDPYELLSVLAKIEDDAGRSRAEPNAARTLDLDILSYNNEVIDDNNLTLPHPEIQNRAFVLYPLQEVAPDWVHPIFGNSVDEMIKNMPKGQKIEQC